MQIHLFRSFVGASGGHIACFESLLIKKKKKKQDLTNLKFFPCIISLLLRRKCIEPEGRGT
jgi:hypothetical protein